MPTLPETPAHDPVFSESSTDPCTGCGESPPSERLQSLADGLAVIVDSLHGPQVPVRVARHVTPLLDSLVVSLTDLAGELAGAELWGDLPHDFAAAFEATSPASTGPASSA